MDDSLTSAYLDQALETQIARYNSLLSRPGNRKQEVNKPTISLCSFNHRNKL